MFADAQGLAPGVYNVYSTIYLKSSSSQRLLDQDSKLVPIKVIVIPDYPINGLTPGFWKNWKNHYTPEEFKTLLAGTFIGPDIEAAKSVFASYNSKKSNEISILKAHLLACQLTLNLAKNPQLINPDQAFLKLSYQFDHFGNPITIGEVLSQATAILANPSAYTREQIIMVKDILDQINNF